MRRVTPDVIALIVVPTVTVLVAGSITLGVLMSVAGVVSVAIGTAATWLLANGGAFVGFVLGGLFLPLVMTGMHQGLIPIHTTLIDQTGWTVLLPVLAMGGAGQIGACIALWVRFRSNASLVRTIRGALPAGFLGVGEPLIYGVTLPWAGRSSPRASAERSAAVSSDCSTSSGTPSGRSPSGPRTCRSSRC
ncbi:PTS transporter subunit EIIC [Curtobacterium poinsettiae]|uniref:PTS transporter subunit EIIC n=1 Tax=Curtobacterium poinsettiae TaxID=159612 RepID=UPI0021C84DF4|nr:PTS transporter subunit EIIC [Curtobacterium flaccumfaciens]MCU0114873.1 PTS transporter subunit EIIC [Curtobacterium flaccumfaciens]